MVPAKCLVANSPQRVICALAPLTHDIVQIQFGSGKFIPPETQFEDPADDLLAEQEQQWLDEQIDPLLDTEHWGFEPMDPIREEDETNAEE